MGEGSSRTKMKFLDFFSVIQENLIPVITGILIAGVAGGIIGGPVGAAVGTVVRAGKTIGLAEKERREKVTEERKTLQESERVKNTTRVAEEEAVEKKIILEMFEKSVDFFNLGGDRIGIVQSYIARLRVCCGDDQDGKKRIESFLESANKNNAYAMLYEAKCSAERAVEAAKENYLNCFVKRLKLMTKYAEDVYKKFENKDDGYWVESTGSDPHQDGKHALFLINKNDVNKKLVYKPRDLSADFAILGKTPKGADGTLPINKNNRPISSSMSEKMNKKIVNENDVYGKKYETSKIEMDPTTVDYELEEESPLATMEIDKESHTEEFVSKQKEMTPEEAKKYFYKAGILDVATKIMAVADLHQDNIMPSGKNRPMIIDPEVSFFNYAGAGLEMPGFEALKQDINQVTKKFSNSSFMIKETIDGEEKIILSGEAFKNKRLGYYAEYKKGYNFMVKKIKNEKMKTSLLKKYGKLLGGFTSEDGSVKNESVGKIRILPLATDELSGCLDNAVRVDIGVLTNDMAIEIKNRITEMMRRGNFIFSNDEFRINFDDDALEEAIKKTLENGTIISMYVNVADGGVYLDGTEVAYFKNKDTEERINRKKIVETAKQRLKNAIENLKLLI